MFWYCDIVRLSWTNFADESDDENFVENGTRDDKTDRNVGKAEYDFLYFDFNDFLVYYKIVFSS